MLERVNTSIADMQTVGGDLSINDLDNDGNVISTPESVPTKVGKSRNMNNNSSNNNDSDRCWRHLVMIGNGHSIYTNVRCIDASFRIWY